MNFVRTLFQFIFGLIFAIIGFVALSPLLASFETIASPIIGLIVGLVIVAIVVLAPNLRRAFGRGFLSTGALIFLLPISMLVLSGTVATDVVSSAAERDQAAAAVGSALAAGTMTALAGVVGFVLGGIFLIIGLIFSLGGKREVIVVKAPD